MLSDFSCTWHVHVHVPRARKEIWDLRQHIPHGRPPPRVQMAESLRVLHAAGQPAELRYRRRQIHDIDIHMRLQPCELALVAFQEILRMFMNIALMLVLHG